MKHPIGTNVDVWSEDGTDHLGIGTIIDYERITTLGETIRIDQVPPVIMLTFGELDSWI